MFSQWPAILVGLLSNFSRPSTKSCWSRPPIIRSHSVLETVLHLSECCLHPCRQWTSPQVAVSLGPVQYRVPSLAIGMRPLLPVATRISIFLLLVWSVDESVDKPPVVGAQSQEASQLVLVLRWWPIFNSLHLSRVRGHSFRWQDMSQLPYLLPEYLAVLGVQLQMGVS